MNYHDSFTPGSLLTFNVNDGFPEAVLRGYRKGIIKKSDYAILKQCDTLEDLKMFLCNSTDYGEKFLENEPTPIHTTTIAEHASKKLVEEFQYLRKNSVEPLTTFLDYITYGYMIDNIILLITGTLHDRDPHELVEKCSPLGYFDALETVTVAQNVKELYDMIIIETPLAPYFKQAALEDKDLSERDVEIIRNTLYKAYLEDFYGFCQTLGGTTAEVMGEILKFEADRRSIIITLNSFGTELDVQARKKLYPSFGFLYPEGVAALELAENVEQVKSSISHNSVYSGLLNESGFGGEDDKTLDTAFYEYEVKINILAFEQQAHYGIYYAYLKLREQEIRNIVWIAECIAQDNKDKINNYIPIF